MTAKNFTGAAASTTLSAGIAAGTTSIGVADGSTYPTANFNIVIDKGLAGEEKVFISSRSGNTFTVSARGADGTIAAAHSSGATVQHCAFGTDFQENNDHVNGSGTVHTAATVSPAALIIPGATSPAQTGEGSAVWDTDDDLLTVGTGSTRKTMVDTNSTQTLTNKTVALGSNTVSGTRAQFNAAMTDDDFASLTGTETLTNKTLTAPAINGGVLNAASTLGGVSGTTLAAERASWQTYTPTVTAETGTLTATVVNSARYVVVGKTVTVNLDITITTNGTGGSSIRATLPVAPVGNTCYGSGRETAITGNLLSVEANSTLGAVIRKYDNSYPGGSGTRLMASVTYETP